jgi:osmotically-inducible protein OsmY
MTKTLPSAPTETLGERIEDAFLSAPELLNAAIHPKVEGGKVTLEGTVDCARDRLLAERVVWAVPGVRIVESRLSVVKPEPAA